MNKYIIKWHVAEFKLTLHATKDGGAIKEWKETSGNFQQIFEYMRKGLQLDDFIIEIVK